MTDPLFANEYLPLSVGAVPAPVLIFLHGRGSDENDLPGLREFLDERFHCISVRAPFLFEFGGYTWYEIFGVGKPVLKELQQSYELLRAFIDSVRARPGLDPSRVFLFGFSMGSMMALTYALRHPDNIRGVVAHSGYIPEGEGIVYQWDRLGPCSFFLAHGALDPVVPVAMGRRAHEMLVQAHAETVYKEYPIPHTISQESLADIARWLTEKLGPIVS